MPKAPQIRAPEPDSQEAPLPAGSDLMNQLLRQRRAAARQGRHDEARISLAAGEALLRSAFDAFGLGVLLTSRAEAGHLAGDAATATASLAAAVIIAAEIGAGPASEIGLALARVRALIEPGVV
jgi:hypothetical protein